MDGPTEDVERYAATLGAHHPVQGRRLAGKVALVAGAGCQGQLLGTGATMAVLFAAQGAAVGVLDVSDERAAETVAHVQAIGGQAIALKADVRERDQCQAAVAALVSAFGGLNILVNNTGVSRKARSLDDITDVDWDFVMDVNVKGVVNVSAAALPHLSGAGSIINVSSIAAQLGMGGLAYSASKGGVLSLTRAMARELGPQNIRVNCVVPGHIIAPMMRPEPEYREALLERLMLGYQGTAWDVAWAAVYLASDEARWITAEILQVDGGSPVSGPMPKPR